MPAVEVMLLSPYIAELIQKGQADDIKDAMSKSNELGMCTFASRCASGCNMVNCQTLRGCMWQVEQGGCACATGSELGHVIQRHVLYRRSVHAHPAPSQLCCVLLELGALRQVDQIA